MTTKATKQPTCTAPGKGEQQCSRCGKTRKGEIPKLGHQWGEWTVLRQPSGKKRGSKEHTCLVCGKTEKELFHEEGSLYEGMEANGEVIRLQTMLKDLGYYGGKIKSGTYGNQTTQAVSKFQKKNKLEASGVATAATLAEITRQWEAHTGKSAADIPTDIKK